MYKLYNALQKRKSKNFIIASKSLKESVVLLYSIITNSKKKSVAYVGGQKFIFVHYYFFFLSYGMSNVGLHINYLLTLFYHVHL